MSEDETEPAEDGPGPARRRAAARGARLVDSERAPHARDMGHSREGGDRAARARDSGDSRGGDARAEETGDSRRSARGDLEDGDLEGGGGPSEWQVPGQVGVGPWPGDRTTWPQDERYDPELLEHGDARNVVDAYRYWRREAVAADLARRAHPFHVAIENFGHDHNIGTVVRTANAFGAAGVHIVGRRRWNRRGAMVTDRYLQVHHHDDVGGLMTFATEHGLVVVAVDNTPGAQRLETADLPRNCLLLFGQEGPGVTGEAHAAAAMTVSIAQFGSTRSINAGVAAGIAMHAWIRQHADLSDAW
jgi:tRNA(Leu) C34 or U34 (ribose-2'-O)-methylase TrmL